MGALWLEERVLAFRDDVPRPSPPRGEALVRVLRAGLCRTDLELARGYYPFTGVPGHEFVGLVVEGPAALSGRRVVGEINASCGACPTCRAGRRTHCPTRSVLGIVKRNGAFAEYLVLPAGNLHPVPDALSTDAAVITEPLAAALRIGEQVPIRPEDRVLVVGDGKLGLLVVRALALLDGDLTLAGRHESKMDLAAGSGARTIFPEAITGGGYDVAIECTGRAEGFEIARRALRPEGTLVLKSTYAGALTLDAAPIVVDEIRVIGSRCGPFAPALRLLAEGKVGVEDLVQGRYPLREGAAAFEHAARPGVLKVLLDLEGEA